MLVIATTLCDVGADELPALVVVALVPLVVVTTAVEDAVVTGTEGDDIVAAPVVYGAASQGLR